MIDTPRKCRKDTTIPTPNGGTMTIPEGEHFFIFIANGEKYFPCEKTFTEEELNHLKIILNKFDAVSIKRFTYLLTELCQCEERRSFLTKGITPSIIDKEIIDLLVACKKMEKKLDNIVTLRTALNTYEIIGTSLIKEDSGFITFDYPTKNFNEWSSRAFFKAVEARNALSDFISHFDSKPTSNKKTGRPKADSSGFVKEITKAYSFCFGERAKMYSDTLKEIVQFALEAIGRDDIKDPVRKLRHALSNT